MLFLPSQRIFAASAGLFFACLLASAQGQAPQQPAAPPASATQPAAPPPASPQPVDSGIRNPSAPAPAGTAQAPLDKHIFGVLPNYRTANSAAEYEGITTKQKFTIAEKDSFDPPGFLVGGAFAGLYQLENQNPSFGQGVKGYAHRYVTAYADQVIGNMMTEAILPTLLREDPRYFRKGTGSFMGRTFYALSRVLVTRTDTGGTRFNYSEVVGNGIAAAVGNAYYPGEVGFVDTMERQWTAIGTDAFSDVLKEFWPDVKKHVFRKHGSAESGK
jgi:hypothetical protein